MSVKSVHPLYTETLADQLLMHHAYKGQRSVKEQRERYLPPTVGMVLDGMNNKTDAGMVAYDAYISRAVYPDLVSDAVEALLGLLHQNPATIDLPAQLEPLRDKATADGEGLQGLLRRINEQQLSAGRLGLLLDLPKEVDPANPLPFIAMYNSISIRNWDDSDDNIDTNQLLMVVLDESGYMREDFEWVRHDKYRILQIGATTENDETKGKYNFYLDGDNLGLKTEPQSPMLRGKVLDQIPFVFINSKDNKATPDNPPLLGIANASMTIYRAEADYRQALYMQGQDTLVVIGGLINNASGEDDDTRVGAGSKLEVNVGGDAKYVGVSSQGLPEMRTSLENDYKRAQAKTGQLIDAMGSKQESGEALKTRISAQTATLNQIADTAAKGLENLLKIAATWMGADPEKVKVTPNKEFADQTISGKDLLDLVQAKNQGAPLSKQTLHAIAAERGLTKLTFEEETDLISAEDPLAGTTAGALAAMTAASLNSQPTNNTPPNNGKVVK